MKLAKKLKEGDKPFWLKDREDHLPCEFEGVIKCEETERKGYWNKVEFSIGYSHQGESIVVGFQKGEHQKGISIVEPPIEMPHISDISVKAA